MAPTRPYQDAISAQHSVPHSQSSAYWPIPCAPSVFVSSAAALRYPHLSESSVAVQGDGAVNMNIKAALPLPSPPSSRLPSSCGPARFLASDAGCVGFQGSAGDSGVTPGVS